LAQGKRDAGGMKNAVVRVFVTLLDAEPAIWRRVEVQASSTLKVMHDIIQIVMGWDDCHLHHFEIGGSLYGEPSPEDKDYDLIVLDERALKLGALADDGQRTFGYVYDYGDNWHCMVVLEATSAAAPGVIYPRLVEGARHGPPEDVGGPWGYLEFLEAIADPKHERNKELMTWSGGAFNPENLDSDQINRTLRQLSPRKRSRSK
jgi:hypothetical protein